MAEKKTIVKIISTVDSKLPTLPVEDGQLIFAYDKKKIALDINGIRTIYEQIWTLDTESQREALLAPVDSFYFVLETSALWRYNNEWIQITSHPVEKFVYKESYLDFPTVGTTEQIYFDTGENATYRWDNAQLRYICVGRDYNNIEIIDGTF